MGSGWQEPNDDGRGKAVLAVAVIVATLVIGIVVDVAPGRNGAQESAPVESQENETVSEPAREETPPGENAQEDDSGDREVADSTRLSGITFTHASRLSGISGTTRTSLARALAMWAASEGVSLDEADVTDDATEDQQGAKASLEAGESPSNSPTTAPLGPSTTALATSPSARPRAKVRPRQPPPPPPWQSTTPTYSPGSSVRMRLASSPAPGRTSRLRMGSTRRAPPSREAIPRRTPPRSSSP